MGRKTLKQKEVVDNLEKIYNSREEIINFFKDENRIKQNKTQMDHILYQIFKIILSIF